MAKLRNLLRTNHRLTYTPKSSKPTLSKHPGFLPGIFSGGGAKPIVMQISIMKFFYCFESNFFLGEKSLSGGNCFRGAPPCPPLPRGRNPASTVTVDLIVAPMRCRSLCPVLNSFPSISDFFPCLSDYTVNKMVLLANICQYSQQIQQRSKLHIKWPLHTSLVPKTRNKKQISG